MRGGGPRRRRGLRSETGHDAIESKGLCIFSPFKAFPSQTASVSVILLLGDFTPALNSFR